MVQGWISCSIQYAFVGFVGVSIRDKEQVLGVQHFNESIIFFLNYVPSHSKFVHC